jgi:hypothetical protein
MCVMLLLPLQVGHALLSTAVSKLVAGSGTVAKLSIIPRTGGALGFTYIPPNTGEPQQAVPESSQLQVLVCCLLLWSVQRCQLRLVMSMVANRRWHCVPFTTRIIPATCLHPSCIFHLPVAE